MTKSKAFKADISAEDRKFLEENGFVAGQPNTIPRNISPVLKSQLLQEMGYPGDGSSPNAQDLNPADGHSTGYVADGQKNEGAKTPSQKTVEQREGGQQDAMAATDTKSKK